MAILKFSTSAVAAQIAHARACKTFLPNWNGPVDRPALILIVGNGVHLRSNGIDGTTTRLCNFESDRRRTELVKACKVGSTWYAAAKVTSLDGTPVEDATYVTDANGSITFGAVFLTRYDDGCWGYKDMEESAGPNASRAPLALIELLSDLKDPDSYARDWRQRCRDWAAIPDYAEGDKIKLAKPVTLTDGSTCQIVTATHYKRGRQKRRCYRIEETGGLVRLSKATLAGSELLSSAKGAASPVLAEYLAGRE